MSDASAEDESDGGLEVGGDLSIRYACDNSTDSMKRHEGRQMAVSQAKGVPTCTYIDSI